MHDRWRILLVVSLALNLFVLGALSAFWLGGRGPAPFLREPQRGLTLGIASPRRLRAALDERHHPALDEALRSHGPAVRERIREVAEARASVAEAIRAEPFDRARLEAAMADLRARQTAVAAAAQGMIVDLVVQLDADGRRRVADLVPARRGRAVRDGR